MSEAITLERAVTLYDAFWNYRIRGEKNTETERKLRASHQLAIEELGITTTPVREMSETQKVVYAISKQFAVELAGFTGSSKSKWSNEPEL
ncbi:hypothetical protein ACYPKM_04975 [Pseudomonas aeruginosa]